MSTDSFRKSDLEIGQDASAVGTINWQVDVGAAIKNVIAQASQKTLAALLARR